MPLHLNVPSRTGTDALSNDIFQLMFPVFTEYTRSFDHTNRAAPLPNRATCLRVKKRTRLCQLNRFKNICRSKEQKHHEKENNKQPNTRENAIVKRMQMVVAMNRSESVTIVKTK